MPVLSNPVLTLRLIDQGDSDGNTPVTGTTVKGAALTNAEGDHSRTALRNYILDLNDSASHKDLTETISGTKSFTGLITADGGIALANSKFIMLGDDSDLQIHHNGTHSYIQDLGTGHLVLAGTEVFITNQDGSEGKALFATDGSVSLMHNGLTKFETGLTGATITGTLTADGVHLGDNEHINLGIDSEFKIYHTGTYSVLEDERDSGSELHVRADTILLKTSSSGSANPDEFHVNCQPGGAVTLYHNNLSKLATTSTGATVLGSLRTSGIALGDNELINIGASAQLQLLYDGSNSIIRDTGAGSLVLRATDFQMTNAGGTANMILAVDGGACSLHHDGSSKLTTTATGVTVTGSLTGDVTGFAGGALITAASADASYRMVFTGQNNYTENSYFYKDSASDFFYNPSTNTLTVGTIIVTNTVTVGSGEVLPNAKRTVFTSSGTWTKTPGVKLVQVTCFGSGGPVSGANTFARGGPGGIAQDYIDVTNISSLSITPGSFGSYLWTTNGGTGFIGGSTANRPDREGDPGKGYGSQPTAVNLTPQHTHDTNYTHLAGSGSSYYGYPAIHPNGAGPAATVVCEIG